MGRLHPCRFRLLQMQKVLEMLVHRVNQAVENGPQQEERRDQEKRRGHVLAIRQCEDALLVCAHDMLKTTNVTMPADSTATAPVHVFMGGDCAVSRSGWQYFF